MTDHELLSSYCDSGSHDAFAELMNRHLGAVYAVCQRIVRNPSDAEEAAQATFLVLMRKAKSVSPKTPLGAWLHRTATFAARDVAKLAQRRARHEQAAVSQPSRVEATTAADQQWESLSAELDELLEHLAVQEKEALMQRYFENKSVTDVARLSGASESAIAKRLTRGLERLRELFKRKGIPVQPAVLLVCLETKLAASAAGAPAGLAAAVHAACFGGAAKSASTLIAKGVLRKMFWLKMQSAGVAAAIALLVLATGMAAVKGLQAGEPKKDPPLAGDPVKAPPVPVPPVPAPAPAPAPLQIKEGVFELPVVAHAQPIASLRWVDSGRALLVTTQLEAVYHDPATKQNWKGYLPSPTFLIDTQTGNATALCRATSCQPLPGNRYLVENYAAIDAQDVAIGATGGASRMNPKKYTLLDATGKVLQNFEDGCSASASPDGKHVVIDQDPAGRNNFFCYKHLSLAAAGGDTEKLTAPVAEKDGRMVGFHAWHWSGDGRLVASIVDMDAAAAGKAPPGMWLSVTPEWYAYDLKAKSWQKLPAAEAASAGRVFEINGGREIRVKSDGIEWVSGAKIETFNWPGLQISRASLRAASADGRKLVMQATASDPFNGDGGEKPAGKPVAPGFYVIDFDKKEPLKLETADRAFMNFYFSAIAFLADHNLVLVNDDGVASVADLQTGKLTEVKVANFAWPAFINTTWAIPHDATGSFGGDRIALLSRQAHFLKTEHCLVVFPGSKDGFVLQTPPNFKLGEYAKLSWSPAGEALAVGEHEGNRIWITRASSANAAAVPMTKGADF